MNDKRKGLIAAAALVGLAAGAAFEHVRLVLAAPATRADTDVAPLETVRAAPRVKTVTITNDAMARASNEALRRRIAELERALAAAAKPADAPAASEDPADPPEERRVRDERSRWQSFAERLERLKTENPEQYAEFQKRREEERQSREQRAQQRASFLESVDTSNMTDEQRENHERLVATLAKLNEYRTLMEQPGFERTPEMREEMGAAFASLGELYSAERRYLLEETARAVGYEGGGVAEFADHVQQIIDNTTMSGFGRRGGDGRGGGSPGGGR